MIFFPGLPTIMTKWINNGMEMAIESKLWNKKVLFLYGLIREIDKVIRNNINMNGISITDIVVFTLKSTFDGEHEYDRNVAQVSLYLLFFVPQNFLLTLQGSNKAKLSYSICFTYNTCAKPNDPDPCRTGPMQLLKSHVIPRLWHAINM